MAQDLNDNVTKPLKLAYPAAGEFTMHEAPATVCPQLATILRWPRRHDTPSERAFCEWLVSEIRHLGYTPTIRALGCITVDVFDKAKGKKKNGTTLFAAHVDTVDCAVTDINARKEVRYDPNFGQVFLDKANTVGSCLGADDGVGVWILLSMLKAKVPGGYVFTRGEECGGLGANAMVNQNRQWLEQFDACVEFDRPRYDEIITHQRGGLRCASDKFGQALAKVINTLDSNFAFKTSTKGVFTDNYAWRGIIPECVNVGVGYDHQHGPGEVLDYGHADALRKACEKVQWEALPVDRDPKEPDPQPQYNYGGSRSWMGFGGKQDDVWDDYPGAKWSSKTGTKTKTTAPAPAPAPAKDNKPSFEPAGLNLEDEVFLSSALDWTDYASAEPELAALMIVDLATELRAMRLKYQTMRDLLAQSLH
jgi:hypothetical protein